MTKLLGHAMELTRLEEKTALINAALEALLEREASRQLAAMGGSDPTATAGQRRRSALPRKPVGRKKR